MEPCGFEESNGYLGPPKGMTAEQVTPLSVLHVQQANGMPVVISCWKLTADEMDEVMRTGRVWLMVMGESHPPLSLHGHPPFTVQPTQGS